MLVSPTGANPLPSPREIIPPSAAVDPEVAARNRTLSAAVRLLNDSAAPGSPREFSIAIDPTTRQAVVRIVDSSTHEVVEQVPSAYLLRVAKELSETIAQNSLKTTDKTISA